MGHPPRPFLTVGKFGDETGINSPPDSTGKVILIARQYPAGIGTPTLPSSDRLDFGGNVDLVEKSMLREAKY